ncbi:hypothetical protein ACIP66_19300 [Pseudomonas sp. NPDC088429]|uniref:hypothetical protein n=1 Tax=Pseudomonas sp. NPDC088429 TaxID=3364455 RepID=UPI0038007220
MGEIDWSPVVQSVAKTNWTAVFVALVTGFTAVAGPIWVWYSQVRRERKSVRAALFVEVAILMELIERRGYLESLREAQQELTGWTDEQRAEHSYEFSVNVAGPYDIVYQANVSKLGSLSECEARLVVRFYQMADSVVADIVTGGLLHRGSSDPQDFADVADILEEALRTGRELIDYKTRGKWAIRKAREK